MYESPLSRIYEEIQTKIIEHEENQILQAVQNCGITVDKEELTRALMYDRQQYEKGYADAKAEERWIPVSERPPEEDGKYLVTAKPTYNHEKQIELAYWQFGKWSGFNQSEILAWKHPPKPYKGEE